MGVVVAPAELDLAHFIKPNDRIVFSDNCGEPLEVLRALIAQGRAIGGLSAFASNSFSGLIDEAALDAFSFSSMGAMGALRKLAPTGRLEIVPCHVGQIGHYIDGGIIGSDVAIVQVSPADANGNHSYGNCANHIQNAVAKARTVIAEVNDRVPFTHGALLPASRIDCAVHVSYDPVSVAPAAIGDTDRAIAGHVCSYIDDGSCIQVGIGGVPDAVIQLIGDRRNLGIHSGMIGDGMADLIETGVVTNSEKPFDQGISITGVLIGSKRLFDFANDNRTIRMHGPDYTHGESVLIQIPKLVSINSALEVDLTGQVNSEQSGSAYLGGTGGQIDYARGASRAPDGRSIIALGSTAKGGTISKIVSKLSGPVTTARTEVDIIITEFGAAELKGQTMRERVRRLIAIAHPDFREELERETHDILTRGF